MPQDSTPTKSKRSRVVFTLFVLLALVVAGVIAAANFILEESKGRINKEIEQKLMTHATSNATDVKIWVGRVKNQVEMFTSQDMLRLFAAEVDNAAIPADTLRRLGKKNLQNQPDQDDPDAPDEESDSKRSDQENRILPRMPMMLNQFKEFAEKNAFLNASLLNKKGEEILAVSDAAGLTEAPKGMIQKVVAGKMPVFGAVRPYDGKLVLDVAFPVLAPLYLSSDERVVAALVVTCNVERVVRDATRVGSENGMFEACVMQRQDKKLQIISAEAGEPRLIDVPDWQVATGQTLPFDLRKATSVSGKPLDVYSVALISSDLPWYACAMVEAARTQTEYENLRRNVLIISVLVIALATIVLLALWWWALGRRERAIADEMRHLYQILNQQKQIMDGVNSALSAGIILNDLNGMIYYANQSFGQISGMTMQNLIGLSYRNLNADMARSLVTHTQAVYQSKKLASFTEVLPVNGAQRHFLTSCSPFCGDNGEVIGVVSVYNDIMDLVMAQRRAQHMITQTVAVFVRAIEAVDPYLCGQSSFTAKLAVALAHYLDKSDDITLTTLRTAASLSQIGMIQLPRELLTKTDKLTAEERAMLEKHVEYARNALAGIEFGIPVIDAITQMYERLDGSGYPAGLKGEQISLNAKILGVANTFCALMRPRSYRSAMDTQQAINLLSAKPYKYDPAVLQALVDFLKSDQGGIFLQNLSSGQKEASA
jgi:PAS domain S-box-containing protein